jgi:tetratricopeptide (TPR) repeat protein
MSLLKEVIQYLLKNFPAKQHSLNQMIFSVLKDIYPHIAIIYGKQFLEENPQEIAFAKVLFKRMEQESSFDELLTLLQKVLYYTDDKELYIKFVQYQIKAYLQKCEILYQSDNILLLDKEIQKLEKKYAHQKRIYYTALYEFYREKSYEKAAYYLQKAVELTGNEQLIRNLYDLHFRYGHIDKALSILPQTYELEILGHKKKTGTALSILLEKGAKITLRSYRSRYRPKVGKVFYLLHNRLPYNSGGYATRTHGLLTNTALFGWDMHGVSRLGYPEDKIKGVVSQATDIVDGIPHHQFFKCCIASSFTQTVNRTFNLSSTIKHCRK